LIGDFVEIEIIYGQNIEFYLDMRFNKNVSKWFWFWIENDRVVCGSEKWKVL